MGVEADHARLVGGRRQIFAGEQFLGAEFGVFGIGQRRQRLWIHHTLVLRQRWRGADEGEEEKQGQEETVMHRHVGQKLARICSIRTSAPSTSAGSSTRNCLRPSAKG